MTAVALTVGELVAYLKFDATGFDSGIASSKTKFASLGTSIQAGFEKNTTAAKNFADKGLAYVGKNEQHINQVAGASGKLGVALLASASAAVVMNTRFDKAMSGVKATGADASKSINKLREAAIKAGADSAFSATESANAIEELAKAGISASDILGGGLKGSLDLAAAGELGVAEAAGIASIAMTQFKLKGKDVGHVADLLAAGAGKAMGSVQDLGMALKQGGLVASQLGLSIEETTGGLAAFAAQGLLGSDAGTSFKTMLQRLTPTSKEAKNQFDDLGISAFNANGEFIGLDKFAGQLKESMKDLTPEARAAAMSVMFGSDAVRAANVLYDQGEQGIRGWIEAVDDQGFAAEVARTRLDNLSGDLEALGGSFETLMIGMGSGADGPLRALVQAADAAVDSLNGLPDPIKQGTLLLAGSAGLTALGVAGLGKLLIGINNAKAAMVALNISTKTAGLALGAIGIALSVATAGIMIWAKKQAEQKAHMEALKDTLDATTGAITEYTRAEMAKQLVEERGFFNNRAGRTAADDAKTMGISLELLTDAMLGNVDAMKQVQAESDAYLNTLGGADRKEWDTANDRVRHLQNVIKDNAGTLEDAQKKQAAFNEAMGDTAPAADGAAGAIDGLTAAENANAQAAAEAAEASEEFRKEIWESAAGFSDLLGAFTTSQTATRKWAEAQAKATKTTKDSWEDFYDDATMNAANWIKELEAQAAAQQNWADNLTKSSEFVRDQLPADMREAGFAMVNELMKRGPEGAAALQAFTSASAAEKQKIIELWTQTSKDAVRAITDQVENAQKPILPITADTDPAMREVGHFVKDASSKKATTKVGASVTADAWNTLAGFRASISRTVRIPIMTVPVGKAPASPYRDGLRYQAHGGIEIAKYANGKMPSQAIIQPATPGLVQWAEPETEGEAFIPLASGKRVRSTEIWKETGKRLGLIRPLANGAVSPAIRAVAGSNPGAARMLTDADVAALARALQQGAEAGTAKGAKEALAGRSTGPSVVIHQENHGVTDTPVVEQNQKALMIVAALGDLGNVD